VTAVEWVRRLERVAVALLLAGAFTFVFSLWLLYGRAYNTHAPAGIDRLLDGGAARPYSARPLVPWLACAAVAPVPIEARIARIDRWAERHPEVESWLAYFQVSRRRAFELAAAALLDGLALAGFLWCIRRLFEAFYATSIWVARLAPVVALLLLPLFFGTGKHFLYDPPALLFAAAALLAVVRRRVHALTVVLGLGTLNKETMALALLVYLLPSFRAALGAGWRRHLAVQSLVVAGARGLAMTLSHPAAAETASNTYLRNYFFDNLAAFARDPFLVSLPRTAAVLFFVLLVFADLPRKPALLRAASPIALPFLALAAWGSQWGEIRVFYELYPLLFLMGYQSCVEWIGLPIASRDAQRATEPSASGGPQRLAPALASALAGLFLLACGATLPLFVLAALQGSGGG
jgi:hypothetical protein